MPKRTRSEPAPSGAKKKRRSRFGDAPAAAAAAVTTVEPASAAAAAALEKARRAALIQSQLSAQIASVEKSLAKPAARRRGRWGSAPAAAASSSGSTTARPMALMLDAQGRQIDAKGNLVGGAATRTASVKANQRAAAQARVNPYLAHRERAVVAKVAPPAAEGAAEAAAVAEEAAPPSNVDTRIKSGKRRVARKSTFKFLEKGALVAQGDKMRDRVVQRMMERESSAKRRVRGPALTFDTFSGAETLLLPSAALRSGAVSAAAAAAIAPLAAEEEAPVPMLEWWDEAFLPEALADGGAERAEMSAAHTYAALDVGNSSTFGLVQHPVVVRPLFEKAKVKPMAMPLTKRERKKLRRQERAAREKDKQGQIAMGIIAPPEPKLKLSNLMRVLQDQAVANPSSIEAKVRGQMAERLKNHEMGNLARKLTPAERAEKKRRKLTEDTSTTTHVAIFRVDDLSSGKARFKIDMNAQQLQLTGLALVCRDAAARVNLVAVEGGPRGVRKFGRLMTKRIQWDERDDRAEAEGGSMMMDMEDEEDAEGRRVRNRCSLVWSGESHTRAFKQFVFQENRTAATALKWAQQRQVGHWWTMACNYVHE